METITVGRQKFIDMADLGRVGSSYSHAPSLSFSAQDTGQMCVRFNKAGTAKLHGTNRMRIQYNDKYVVFTPSDNPADNKISGGRESAAISCAGLRNLGLDRKRFRLYQCGNGWAIKRNEPIGTVPIRIRGGN